MKAPMRFLKDESGANAIEYCLLTTIITIVAIGAMTAIGTNVTSSFANAGAALR